MVNDSALPGTFPKYLLTYRTIRKKSLTLHQIYAPTSPKTRNPIGSSRPARQKRRAPPAPANYQLTN
jgi:hypothetical protein